LKPLHTNFLKFFHLYFALTEAISPISALPPPATDMPPLSTTCFLDTVS
jgi:hypothetical protein